MSLEILQDDPSARWTRRFVCLRLRRYERVSIAACAFDAGFKDRVQVSHVLYASSRDVRGPAARYELNAGDLRSHDHSAPSIWW